MSSVRDGEPDETRAAVPGEDDRGDGGETGDDWWSASPGGAIAPPRDPGRPPAEGAPPATGAPDVTPPSYEEPPPEPAYVPPPYAPPPSPAYFPVDTAPPPRPRRPVPPGPEPGPSPSEPAAPASRIERSHRAGGRMLLLGLVLVAVAVGVLIIEATGSSKPDRYVFGTVATSTSGVTLQTGATGSGEPTTLSPGDDVIAGSVVETTGDAAAVIDLAGGGIVRVEGDARVVFLDLAADPQTGKMGDRAEPAVQVDGGRVWIHPAEAGPLEVQVPGGVLATGGAPVAVDCDPVCAIEAPAGGVTATTGSGNEVTPGPGELLAITSDHGFDATFADAPSDWSAENLDADRAAGISAPDADAGAGIRGSAHFGGTFALAFDVTSEPEGDAIPEALTYHEGGDYAVTVLADATRCEAPPCTVPISGLEGGAGSAEVSEGSVVVSFKQDIDCFDQDNTTVVVPAIGATTVEATLAIDEAEYEGGRWVVTSLAGEGTVNAALTKTCNPSDVLGSATSEIAATVTAAK